MRAAFGFRQGLAGSIKPLARGRMRDFGAGGGSLAFQNGLLRGFDGGGKLCKIGTAARLAGDARHFGVDFGDLTLKPRHTLGLFACRPFKRVSASCQIGKLAGQFSKGFFRHRKNAVGIRHALADVIAAAFAGLKLTLGDCDRTLAERLQTAERYAADLAQQIEAGQVVMERISQIVSAASMVAPKAEPAPEKPALSRMASAADAAAAIRARAARRLEGQAA